MNDSDNRTRTRGKSRQPRNRNPVIGILLILLGAWGALIPFFGPHFNFGYTADQPWVWTGARGWLEVLPGAATVWAGQLLMSRSRATAMFGGWLAVLAGAWFLVGRTLAGPLGIGAIGAPVAATDARRTAVEVAYFSGVGTLIIVFGALALGRYLVPTVRDIPNVRSSVAAPMDGQAQQVREPTTTEPSAPPPATQAEPRQPQWRDRFSRRHTTAH